MREIKFRLRIDNKIVGYEKWYTGHQLESDPCCACPRWLYSKEGEYWNPSYIYHKQKDQYIGFKDKNGKEIYENDILEFRLGLTRKIKAQVKWSGYESQFYLDWHTGRIDKFDKEFSDKSKVIGNIYEKEDNNGKD